MSGASAMAAARRRRAGNQESIQTQSNINKQVPIINENNNEQISNNRLTPLEILKMHDTKIKELELLLTNNNLESKELSINYDENKIVELLSQKIDKLVSNKLNNINDTIKSMLINIEKLSNIANINEKYLNKTEDFVNELNGLKMLVIKNQTLSLETNNDIIKIKDEIKEINNLINEDNDTNSNTNDLFISMFNNMNITENSNIFSKINIEDDDINLKNIESLEIESIETLETLESVRNDIKSEILEKKDVCHEKESEVNVES